MADFAEQFSDEQASQRLTRAIQGKGAFRRFKVELHEEYPQLLPAWYVFRDAGAHRRALQWLADNCLVDAAAAARFLNEHAEPKVPQPARPFTVMTQQQTSTRADERASPCPPPSWETPAWSDERTRESRGNDDASLVHGGRRLP
jgi:hypothetical protein